MSPLWAAVNGPKEPKVHDDAPRMVELDGQPAILLPNGTLHFPDESWCLGCEALDPKGWRFPPEVAREMDWLICADCQDLLGIDVEPITP